MNHDVALSGKAGFWTYENPRIMVTVVNMDNTKTGEVINGTVSEDGKTLSTDGVSSDGNTFASESAVYRHVSSEFMKKSSLEKMGGARFKFGNPDGTQDIIHSMTYLDGTKSFMFGKVSADGKSITLDNGHVYQSYVPER